MEGSAELIRLAAGGSRAAQIGLVDLAIAAGASGQMRQIESLMAAETWARLASSVGEAPEHRALVGVLLARAEFEASRGAVDMTGWYVGEAKRVLKLLAALGDPDANAAIEELGGRDRQHPEPDAVLMANLTKAANGDFDALATLFDDAYALIGSPACEPLEAFTACELYARLGASQGDSGHIRRLAGIMLKRAEWEHNEGSAELAAAAVSDAVSLLTILVDAGDTAMAPWLSLVVETAPRNCVVKAAATFPTVLRFIDPEGNC